MGSADRAIGELLDDMALKLVMVEPGDLSGVGELLELAEQLLACRDPIRTPDMTFMTRAFKLALEKIIMAELSDSAENFEQLGGCLSIMQNALRKQGILDSPSAAEFRNSLVAIGLQPEELEQQFAADNSPSEKPAASPSEPVASAAATPPAAEINAPPAPGGQPVPDFLQDRDLIAGFIAESFEHLESIEVNVLRLEEDPNDLEVINSIFRPFHTIKGVSGFLNLKQINKLAHSTENLLDDVRNGRMAMGSEIIDVVLSVGDFMRTMIQNLKDVFDKGQEHYVDYDISQYVERVLNLQSTARGAAEETPAAAEAPRPAQIDTPPPDEPEKIAEELPEEPEVSPALPERELPALIPSRAAFAPVDGTAGPKQPTGPRTAEARRQAIGDAIKVDIEKLDNLVNAVGELVIMQSQVRSNPLLSSITDQKLTRDFSQLSRITSELQKTAMSMRMVPIRQTFQKMIRLVRDLSKKSGKQVDLVMRGEETEIDRNMVDSIYDPLVHMIRNSVDHGIQLPEERRRAGKPERGTVNLRAFQKGGNIVIEIEDDGEGLNRQKIRAKAIERNIISSESPLSDHEIENLIFMPGFSTADKVTDVSGRGVGMDVVKKAVERLRGKVEVSSQPGNGTLFVIRLPLTLAIIDGILVRVGRERYIIPTISIQESIRPTAEMLQTVHNKGEALLIRNSLIPIVRLYKTFNITADATDPTACIVVVVENEGQQRALMVDELLGKQEVVIKSLGGYMTDIDGVAGGTILGDGRVGLILDLAGLFAATGR